MAMNRICEEDAAKNETFRRKLERNQRVVLSNGRQKSEEELLEKLHSIGLKLKRHEFEGHAREFLSAQEMAESLYRTLSVEDKDSDWLWICLTCLWERWLPERPSMEMIDDLMQNGYESLNSKTRLPPAKSGWRHGKP
jgi:hypothetical protein